MLLFKLKVEVTSSENENALKRLLTRMVKNDIPVPVSRRMRPGTPNALIEGYIST